VLELKYRNLRYDLLCSLLKKDGNTCSAQGYSDTTHSSATDMQYTHLVPTNLTGAICW